MGQVLAIKDNSTRQFARAMVAKHRGIELVEPEVITAPVIDIEPAIEPKSNLQTIEDRVSQALYGQVAQMPAPEYKTGRLAFFKASKAAQAESK